MVRVVVLVLLRLVVLVLVLGVHESRHRDGWKGDQHPGISEEKEVEDGR